MADDRADRAADVCRELGAHEDQAGVVAAMLELGVSVDAMRRAMRGGRLEEAIFDAVLGPERMSRTVSAREIERRGGWPVRETLAMISAFGFPKPAPDEPFFNPAEAEALVAAAARSEWWPIEAQMAVSRVWGQAIARIAGTEVQRFRLDTETRVLGDSVAPEDALATIQRALAELLPLADPLLLGLHRRWVEYELNQHAVREAEQRAPGGPIPGAIDLCLFFCDLKDFTAFADLNGDAAATAAASRFAEVIADERGDEGQVVKGLGDGAMLVYPDAEEAVAAWERFRAAMSSADTPALHGSIHQGIVVRHESDYFGGAVNLAARLLSLAGRDELLATRTAVDRAAPSRQWTHLGTRRLRGLREPVEIYRLGGARPAMR